MQPPTKDQADIGVDNPTIDASDGAELEDGNENKDMTDQRYKDEADINYMLSRFGVTPPRGAPTYGETDDTLDLQLALQSIRDANEAYSLLPKELKAKFSTMGELLTAVENGSLVTRAERPAEQPVTPPAVPPA